MSSVPWLKLLWQGQWWLCPLLTSFYLVSLLFSYFRSVLSHLNITHNLFTSVCSHLWHCFVIFWHRHVVFERPWSTWLCGTQLGLHTHITTTGHFGCVACCLFVFTAGAKQRCCLVMHDAYFVGMLDHNSCFYKVENWKNTYIQIFSYWSSTLIPTNISDC